MYCSLGGLSAGSLLVEGLPYHGGSRQSVRVSRNHLEPRTLLRMLGALPAVAPTPFHTPVHRFAVVTANRGSVPKFVEKRSLHLALV